MATYECQACRGSGTVQVKRTDSKGKTITVTEDCKGCRGSGVIER
ncbi:hypothetical protein ACQEU3_46895 [Spirillospora sp. CA-253888]